MHVKKIDILNTHLFYHYWSSLKHPLDWEKELVKHIVTDFFFQKNNNNFFCDSNLIIELVQNQIAKAFVFVIGVANLSSINIVVMCKDLKSLKPAMRRQELPSQLVPPSMCY